MSVRGDGLVSDVRPKLGQFPEHVQGVTNGLHAFSGVGVWHGAALGWAESSVVSPCTRPRVQVADLESVWRWKMPSLLKTPQACKRGHVV